MAHNKSENHTHPLRYELYEQIPNKFIILAGGVTLNAT
jgi:hypothetical protein